MTRAMEWRWQEPVVEKTGLSCVQPYDNWRECRSVAELAAIAENPNAIHMEGLCIRERILGKHMGEFFIFLLRSGTFCLATTVERGKSESGGYIRTKKFLRLHACNF
jgi:hypothetical protein